MEGHTDVRGPEQPNQALSERREARVRREMVDRHGIESARLEARGFGGREPLSGGTTPTEHALNRRVVFRVLNPEALVREREK